MGMKKYKTKNIIKAAKKEAAKPAKPFELLTNKQKRIAIAKDVIARLKARKVVPVCGSYLRGEGTTIGKAIAKPCQACAKGAMILSRARLAPPKERFEFLDLHPYYDDDGGELPVKLLTTSDEGFYELEAIFGYATFTEIERVFEGYCPHGWVFTKYPDEEDRMMAIMMNIVRNKGEFFPQEMRHAQ